MAFTEVPLPADTWVAVQSGEALGLIKPSIVGDIRVRTETTPPTLPDNKGIPLEEFGNVFELATGVTLYAISIRNDSLVHVNIQD